MSTDRDDSSVHGVSLQQEVRAAEAEAGGAKAIHDLGAGDDLILTKLREAEKYNENRVIRLGVDPQRNDSFVDVENLVQGQRFVRRSRYNRLRDGSTF